ncbi:MAG: hypothetical protein CMN60_20235 [Sphingobium sp.]|nr:hypothetical protein [Sphingobium sp.]|tara:strand:- start:15857 stop:16177 length:321 start_codon:yes stop_codon:yes gene_type:complete
MRIDEIINESDDNLRAELENFILRQRAQGQEEIDTSVAVQYMHDMTGVQVTPEMIVDMLSGSDIIGTVTVDTISFGSDLAIDVGDEETARDAVRKKSSQFAKKEMR